MESILGKILVSAMMCAATGADPEVESKKCVDEVMKELFGDERPKEDSDVNDHIIANLMAGMPMCVKAEHKAEWDRSKLEVQVTGHPYAIRVGSAALLETVAKAVAKEEGRVPSEIVKEICDDAIRKISRGGV